VFSGFLLWSTLLTSWASCKSASWTRAVRLRGISKTTITSLLTLPLRNEFWSNLAVHSGGDTAHLLATRWTPTGTPVCPVNGTRLRASGYLAENLHLRLPCFQNETGHGPRLREDERLALVEVVSWRYWRRQGCRIDLLGGCSRSVVIRVSDRLGETNYLAIEVFYSFVLFNITPELQNKSSCVAASAGRRLQHHLRQRRQDDVYNIPCASAASNTSNRDDIIADYDRSLNGELGINCKGRPFIYYWNI